MTFSTLGENTAIGTVRTLLKDEKSRQETQNGLEIWDKVIGSSDGATDRTGNPRGESESVEKRERRNWCFDIFIFN